MKNLFLTLALMCCVSFAFANEGEKPEQIHKEPLVHGKTNKMGSVLVDPITEIHLTCGGTFIVASVDPATVLAKWRQLEAKYCRPRIV